MTFGSGRDLRRGFRRVESRVNCLRGFVRR